MDYKYLACIHCRTYNQKDYVEKALHGIVTQKTTFPVVDIVIDDASTDGTADIITNYVESHFNLEDSTVSYKNETDYAKITFAQHKENKNCYVAVLLLKENHFQLKKPKAAYITEWVEKAKYSAFCDGDDWWTDDYKIQKLVDFLENHPKYVLACHRFDRYIQAEDRYEHDNGLDVYFGKRQGVSFGRYYNRFINWRTQTLATVYNREILSRSTKGYLHIITDGVKAFFPLKYGKGYCFNEHMAVYRVNSGGIYSRLSSLEQIYANWIMFRDFNLFDKSFFSKISYWEAYSRVLKANNWQDYKDAQYRLSIRVFEILFTNLRRVISFYYKICHKLH